MRDRRRASRLRQQIARRGGELFALQEQMLRARRMIAASLVERHLGTADDKRASSAFYLSCATQGRTRLVYIPKAQVERVRVQVEAWRAYRAALQRWRALSQEMAGLLRELGEAQASRPGEEKR